MTPTNPVAAALEIKDALQIRDIDRAARLLEAVIRRWPSVSFARERLMVRAGAAANDFANGALGALDLISVPRLAAATGRSEAAVRASFRRSELPAAKIGRRWFVRRKDIDRLFDDAAHELELRGDAREGAPEARRSGDRRRSAVGDAHLLLPNEAAPHSPHLSQERESQ